MNANILKDMLLISDPSVFKLYKELISIAGYFVAPVFTIALIIEYLSDMNFTGVLKKLLIIVIFMGAFYGVHTKAVDISLITASKTLKKVSPRNLFVKKWFYGKVKTKKKKMWSSFEAFAIPNLNDLVATLFYVLSKVFIWLLKLIYSSVYHLTYIFAGFTAILYFLGWTKDALKGTIQASLWCMILPFVIVAILALVGNSMEDNASLGHVAFASIDNLVWLFGVTLLLLISPLITYGMIKGDGIHSAGAKMGAMMVSSGTHAMTMLPLVSRFGKTATNTFKRGRNGLNRVSEKVNQLRENRSQLASKSSSLKSNRFASSDNKSKRDSKSLDHKDNKTTIRDNTQNNTAKHTDNSQKSSSKLEQRISDKKHTAQNMSQKEFNKKNQSLEKRLSKDSSTKMMIKDKTIKRDQMKKTIGGRREL